MKLKLLILDVDGVLTDGTKHYNAEHEALTKTFMCKDFTAIKRFMAAGVTVIMISGDAWNAIMATKRRIDFYCTRVKDNGLDKSQWIEYFSDYYKVDTNEMMFVGDDYFDLQMFEKLYYTICPNDAPEIIKNTAWHVLKKSGGQGCLVELYDLCINKCIIEDAKIDDVLALDKLEATSEEMSGKL